MKKIFDSRAGLFRGDNFLRFRFARLDNLVKRLNKRVGVDTVSRRALLNIFKLRDVAAETAHSRVKENFNRFGIFHNDFGNIHIFCDFHKNCLLKPKNYITNRYGVNEFSLKNFLACAGNFWYNLNNKGRRRGRWNFDIKA